MALAEISNAVLLLSNPAWYGHGLAQSTVVQNISAAPGALGYSSRLHHSSVTTLAAEYLSSSQNIQGLLYVPDLGPTDPCRNEVQPFVPPSAARRADLPPASFNLIGLAPWVSPECTQSFLASARRDPIRAFIFYRPYANNTATPPHAGSEVWDLDDDGAWRTENRFPVVAVPGSVGSEMMTQLSLYSGNITTVPYGERISALYDPMEEDYVRIWTKVNISLDRKLNNMWILIPVVLGLLLAAFIGTSLTMHLVQRRRRSSLRNRVQNGEVNLEALGVTRLTTPPNHVRSFPLFTYSYKPETWADSPAAPEQAHLHAHAAPPTDDGSISPVSELNSPAGSGTSGEKSNRSGRSKLPHHSNLYYQPTCRICLEDYEDRRTIIRELPCGHIFHPECIDELLTDVSSLCPLCKASMLPPGYSPRITNDMVRREMATRRLRSSISAGHDTDLERGSRDSSEGGQKWSELRRWGGSLARRLTPSRGPATATPAPVVSTITPPPRAIVVPFPPRQFATPTAPGPESVVDIPNLPPSYEEASSVSPSNDGRPTRTPTFTPPGTDRGSSPQGPRADPS